MKRYGAVIVFREWVTEAQAAQVLKDMAVLGCLIEDPSRPPDPSWDFPGSSGVNEFDDDVGGPVWYIP